MSRNHLHRSCYISLACSIGSFSLACGSVMQLQSSTDRISVQRGMCLTSLGFLYFISLTDFFNKYFIETPQGILFRKKYHLMISDVMDITNKIVSAVQALFSFLAGLIVCKSTCSKSFLYASHCIMEAYAWFGTAYFMYDIWSMYKVHKQKLTDKLKLMNISTRARTTFVQNQQKNNSLSHDNLDRTIGDGLHQNNGSYENTEVEISKNQIYDNHKLGDYLTEPKLKLNQFTEFLNYLIKNPVMVIHHIFIGTFGFLVIVYIRGAGVCIYSFMFMMEFSTPFVSLRGILSKLGMKDSNVYIINGFTMLITFFICRVFMWPYVLHWYSTVINKPFIQSFLELPRGCKISIAILFFPQIYWFYLMLKGAFKVFFPNAPQGIQKYKNNNLSPETPENPFSPKENLLSSHLKKTINLENETSNNMGNKDDQHAIFTMGKN